MNPVLTTTEVAQMLACTEETVEIAARDGRLPGLQYGRGWVFPAEALIERLNAQARDRKPRETPAPSAVHCTVPVDRREAANSPRVGRKRAIRPDLGPLLQAATGTAGAA